ncbi:acyl-CoA N-acyltransferase [Ascobolus immersus RN42]|uniref:N-terminal methionine N(alpha)-acetyltransferase NatC n=1 Tax=Ascobolus immersus RN42 TaxID=1160509 RepID=A0A3N4HZN9_ASCIM|nr:acyl-CoA N-acyltransferase [Ascobolus immersus RN42]
MAATATTIDPTPPSKAPLNISRDAITYHPWDPQQEPLQLSQIRKLISKDLSEPYSIYVYRYFLYQWGDLCYIAMHEGKFVGCVVSKLEPHRNVALRGYIAMLAVEEEYRGLGIASKLVRMAIDAMIEKDADEVALETEISNTAAIKLYERLGFLRSKRLHRYYLNGSSAFRLILYLKNHLPPEERGILEDAGCCGGHDGHSHDHAEHERSEQPHDAHMIG